MGGFSIGFPTRNNREKKKLLKKGSTQSASLLATRGNTFQCTPPSPFFIMPHPSIDTHTVHIRMFFVGGVRLMVWGVVLVVCVCVCVCVCQCRGCCSFSLSLSLCVCDLLICLQVKAMGKGFSIGFPTRNKRKHLSIHASHFLIYHATPFYSHSFCSYVHRSRRWAKASRSASRLATRAWRSSAPRCPSRRSSRSSSTPSPKTR